MSAIEICSPIFNKISCVVLIVELKTLLAVLILFQAS